MRSINKALMWLCALALLAPAAVSQAKMLMRITISGPGLQGEVEVADQQVLQALFELPAGKILSEAPPGSKGAHYIINQEVGADGQVVAVNVYHYYPDPQGGPGFLLFADVVNGSASIEGAWFRLDERTGRALQAFLADNGVVQLAYERGFPSGEVVFGAGALGTLLILSWLFRWGATKSEETRLAGNKPPGQPS